MRRWPPQAGVAYQRGRAASSSASAGGSPRLSASCTWSSSARSPRRSPRTPRTRHPRSLGKQRLASPSRASEPTAAITPESQADSTIRPGGLRSASRSWTVSGPSASWRLENIGLSRAMPAVRRDVHHRGLSRACRVVAHGRVRASQHAQPRMGGCQAPRPRRRRRAVQDRRRAAGGLGSLWMLLPRTHRLGGQPAGGGRRGCVTGRPASAGHSPQGTWCRLAPAEPPRRAGHASRPATGPSTASCSCAATDAQVGGAPAGSLPQREARPLAPLPAPPTPSRPPTAESDRAGCTTACSTPSMSTSSTNVRPSRLSRSRLGSGVRPRHPTRRLTGRPPLALVDAPPPGARGARREAARGSAPLPALVEGTGDRPHRGQLGSERRILGRTHRRVGRARPPGSARSTTSSARASPRART